MKPKTEEIPKHKCNELKNIKHLMMGSEWECVKCGKRFDKIFNEFKIKHETKTS